MTELHDLTALEQRDGLREGAFSSTELTGHYLQRIGRHGEELGAFVTLTEELAREEAARADDALRAGEDGALLGLPFAFKDLHFVAGVPITMGSTAFDPIVAEVDGWTVGLIRQAGAVTVGTTHAPEFGGPCYTHSDVVGRPAVTPYDTSRYASGSSGGTAAAVAAGLLPVGHGSDGAGSIRLPASVCGLVGLKPTRGRVSNSPLASYFSWTTEGPIARTIADAALLLDVMAQPPGADLYRLTSGEPSFLAAGDSQTTQPKTIALWTDNGLVEPTAEVLEAVRQTAELLTSFGHTIVEIDNPLPWNEDRMRTFLSVFGAMATSIVEQIVPEERRDRLQDFTKWLVALGAPMRASEVMAAADLLALEASHFLAVAGQYDAVLTPCTTAPAVPVGYFHELGVDQLPARMVEWAAHTPIVNMTGLPAIVLPVHTTGESLPVAVQLTGGQHGDEALLLSLGAALENALRWQDRHPPQWSS